MPRFPRFDPRAARSGSLLLAALTVTLAGCAKTPPSPMSPEEITVPASSHTSPLSYPSVPLRTGTLAESGTSPATAYSGVFSQRFGSVDQASRSAVTVVGGRWRVHRSVELFPETEPQGLLASRDRVVVLGRVWQLYDRDGKRLVHALSGPGAVALSEGGEAVLALDATGALRRYAAATGALEFRVGAGRGGNVHYALLTARGPDYLLCGVQRALDPHGLNPPRSSYLQAFRVSPPYSIDDDHLLQATESEQDWDLPGLALVGAALGESCVFARRDQLFITDRTLVIRSSFSGSFLPRTLSLDERGNAHLLVESDRGPRYWRISPDGVLALNVALAGGAVPAAVPPLPLPGGRVLLPMEGQLMLIEADGSHRASVRLQSKDARWVTQADGSGLLTDGGTLSRLDRELRSEVLFSLDDEFFSGPAVALDATTLAVVTPTRLLLLQPSP